MMHVLMLKTVTGTERLSLSHVTENRQFTKKHVKNRHQLMQEIREKIKMREVGVIL